MSLNTRALQNCYGIYLDEIKKGIDLELAHFPPLINEPGVPKPIVELHLLSMIFPDRNVIHYKFGVGWECDKCGELRIPNFLKNFRFQQNLVSRKSLRLSIEKNQREKISQQRCSLLQALRSFL